ncbi:type IV pilin protein [Aeromonas encheleia]|uniref:type IV pilin protein n=1 Tax=Aeromonas encheleia TaxID=73010 RepID=UPI001F58FEBE|nr:type IV pilin protein [Aeromonas encheleia]UNP88033.1 type IV pilin protein [Aeromonas encheleia]
MKKPKGFSLLELMIVVVVVAILSAVAYPSYQAHIAASRRAEAKAALMEAAQYMEREFTQAGSYNAANLVSAGLSTLPRDGGSAYYQLVVNASGAVFTLIATPTGGMGGDECGVLMLDQVGRQTVSGASLTAADCW